MNKKNSKKSTAAKVSKPVVGEVASTVVKLRGRPVGASSVSETTLSELVSRFKPDSKVFIGRRWANLVGIPNTPVISTPQTLNNLTKLYKSTTTAANIQVTDLNSQSQVENS